jgi:glycerate dehydrogenase
MNNLQGVILDLASIDRDDLDLSALQRVCPQWRTHPKTAPNETAERIGDARIAVSNKVVLDRAVMAACPQLKLICIAATGTNNVDLAAARELGIAVCNVVGYATPAVVQHVFALILDLTTRLTDYRRAVARGDWQRSELFCLLDYPIRELTGRRLGIVGYGELGRAVGKVADAFGMEVVIAQRPGGDERPGRLPLNELLPMVDILSLHCPLTEDTRDLIGAEELALMKSDALLINTARGGIVDEPALAAALRRGMIGGAGVDVLSTEPPREGNVLLAGDIPNLIVTPHVAWASRESRQRLLNEVELNIRAFLDGEARNRVEA